MLVRCAFLYLSFFFFNEIKLKGEILDDGIYVIEWFCWGIYCWVSPQSYIACEDGSVVLRRSLQCTTMFPQMLVVCNCVSDEVKEPTILDVLCKCV